MFFEGWYFVTHLSLPQRQTCGEPGGPLKGIILNDLSVKRKFQTFLTFKDSDTKVEEAELPELLGLTTYGSWERNQIT